MCIHHYSGYGKVCGSGTYCPLPHTLIALFIQCSCFCISLNRFLIAVLALICHTLWVFPVLNFAAIGFTDMSFSASVTFHLCWDQAWIISLDAVATPKWKSKNLWIFYYKWRGCPFLMGVNLPPVSLILWVGWNFETFKGMKEWGLDVPIVCLWLLHIFVSKPVCSALVLCGQTIKFANLPPCACCGSTGQKP